MLLPLQWQRRGVSVTTLHRVWPCGQANERELSVAEAPDRIRYDRGRRPHRLELGLGFGLGFGVGLWLGLGLGLGLRLQLRLGRG